MHQLRLKSFALSVVFTAFLSFAPILDAFAIDTTAKQAILIDFETKTVLYEKNADEQMAPSSMSKLMTVYMVFERLKDGSLSLDDQFLVSEEAWRKGGSKMFVEVGQRIRLEDLLRGIIIQSGNDACIVVAENLSTSEEAFAREMTIRGRELGLENSTFVNATGWPDPGQLMTARDLSTLSRRLVEDFPEFYSLFKERSFTYNSITQSNRNPLLYRPSTGADGLKTGHTDLGGYGLVGSAVRDGRRLIVVLNGLESKKARGVESERLLKWGFREYDNYQLFTNGETVTEAPVWLGSKALVPLVVKQDVLLTLPRRSRQDMKVKVVYEGPLPAPLKQGANVAKLVIEAPGIDTIEIPLVAGEDIGRLGFVGRLGAAFSHILWGFAS